MPCGRGFRTHQLLHLVAQETTQLRPAAARRRLPTQHRTVLLNAPAERILVVGSCPGITHSDGLALRNANATRKHSGPGRRLHELRRTSSRQVGLPHTCRTHLHLHANPIRVYTELLPLLVDADLDTRRAAAEIQRSPTTRMNPIAH